ncbi:MAG: ABC transporter substrate-binding protein, partial [Euryarchaeota archaeon]|nr:ABC transporter substrate-binding protein [Euryarchaeota archaeon]
MSLAVMPAGAADYTLGIFGNANMDDTIDEDDIAYVEGIIEGTNERTELADADYDGEVDEDDITQIELIIRGEEEELTVMDSLDRIVTVKKPVERIVMGTTSVADVTRMLGAQYRVVGVAKYIVTKPTYYPELSKLPSIGGIPPDAEMILSLNPDLVTTWEYDITKHDLDKKLPGIPVVAF